MTYALSIAAAALLAALLVSVFFGSVVPRLTRRTTTDFDDLLVQTLRAPVALTIAFTGVLWAILAVDPPAPIPYLARGMIFTGALVLWAAAAVQMWGRTLEKLSIHQDRFAVVSGRTLPVFEFFGNILVYGGAVYFLFLAWQIDLTAWLASAGIIGIAVGFAAKDTVANLFAGVSILADSPYKLGDYLILDSGERGYVTEIGIRTTRLLTRDDVEIILPNSFMANSKIINESGGPSEGFRVRAQVEVAYGSDVDHVKEVLLGAVEAIPRVLAEPAPRVRFREFGASGLVFQLLLWVEKPELRGRILDAVNTNIYKRFAAAGIEIPYSKHDVYLRRMDDET